MHLAMALPFPRHHRGCIRIAPSNRTVSPFMYPFRISSRAMLAYSSALPRRGGNGTMAPSACFISGVARAMAGLDQRRGEYAVFMMLIAVFLGGGGKCSIDRRLPKEL